ncbi:MULTISPECIES: amino acid permease [unclassified Burkholderia]|uniref:amino acid permease n=1 Tax=unclassified Burkholderia TaxID=2613784 RepID=UPI0005CEE60E|nr:MULTISPECIES: amino acid permease [unclassified Burkholderia]TGN98720.1 amino acid permease [Burkholderia sp. USMB20]
MSDTPQHNELRRALKDRHIQLIALGGAIGTGLFLGISETIKVAGPSAILGYAIAGLFAFFIMRQLSEMVVDEPVSGSFSHFAEKYCGHFFGFLSGWNYWVMCVLVGMAELSAVGVYIQYWLPGLSPWISALGFFIIVNLINLVSVKSFGETEFWFSLVKIVAVVAMIVFGCYLLFTGTAGPQAGVSNLWRHGGFFPNGFGGLAMALAGIMFSFGGLELVGIAAAEASAPERTIPKATNQVIYRILIFYIGALVVLLSLYPWEQAAANGSPFVLIFHELNRNGVANVLNLVVLSAALSVYNSVGVYGSSRILFGLAKQGNAPSAALKVSKRGVPVAALAVSAIATAICILVNYVMPGRAFGFLMGLVVSALVINWLLITLIHLAFRREKARRGESTAFPSIGYPLTNIITILFLFGILVVMYVNQDLRLSVLLIPVWISALALSYRFGVQKKSFEVSPKFGE